MNSKIEDAASLPAPGRPEAAWANTGERAADLTETEPPSGAGLNLQFRRAPLEAVLDYLRRSAGLVIRVGNGVQVDSAVDLYRDQPVTTTDALSLLKRVLRDHGCTLIQNGPSLSVVRTQDVKKHWITLPFI